MPESVTDRPTSAHESIFLLTKSARYWYDAEAVRQPDCGHRSGNNFVKPERLKWGERGNQEQWTPGNGSNLRNVWHLGPEPYPEAHFATFPSEIPRRAILAGCPAFVCSNCGVPLKSIWLKQATWGSACGCADKAAIPGVVLDPFMGSGTTAMVAQELGRKWIGIELNPEYAKMVDKRAQQYGMAL